MKFTPTLFLMLLACAASWSCAAPLSAHKADTDKQTPHATNMRTVIWQDTGRASSLNLIYGAGGRGHAPDPKGRFTFLEEDRQATTPKFDIRDEQGVEWKVKLGEEPQSETAAARLLWAAGYFVDEDYYLPEFTVTALPTLRRGEEFVSRDGTIHGARLERPKGVVKHGNWDCLTIPSPTRGN
jgi:hypothetical protein